MRSNTRRKVLIEQMNQLEGQGATCKGCQGNCCTYEANSMMVTPLGALDLILYLKSESALTPQLYEKCQETIKKFRLDHPNGNGRRSFVRRTYTCPFFNHQELGCPLPKEVKPYGCLAFNAHHIELKAGEHCYSDKDLLIGREKANPLEDQENETIKKKLKINWDKTPLPLALLDLWYLNI